MIRWAAALTYWHSPRGPARKIPNGDASQVARKRASLAASARSMRPRSTARATPCATTCKQDEVLLLADRPRGGREPGHADQQAVHEHRDQRQRAIAVRRDQLGDRAAQELARARQPEHPAALQVGQERRLAADRASCARSVRVHPAAAARARAIRGSARAARRSRRAGSSRRGRRPAAGRPRPARGGSPRRARSSAASGARWPRSPPPRRRCCRRPKAARPSSW